MKEKIIACIDQNVPLIYREGMKNFIRPVIRIQTKKCVTGSLPVGSSKIGGFPDLPSGVEWPYSLKDKEKYRFVAQFNLKELVSFDEEGVLPKDGMLYFFIDFGSGTVLYSSSPVDQIVRAEVPVIRKPEKLSFRKSLNLLMSLS
ncbi:MAG: DUF1963 domain-containing protein [Candidatus Omnitrophota bacterium]